MVKIKVKKYTRKKQNGKGKVIVKGYLRKKRPKGKKKIVGKKVLRYNVLRDEYGRVMGLKRRKGK
jgi:hypothetical protein